MAAQQVMTPAVYMQPPNQQLVMTTTPQNQTNSANQIRLRRIVRQLAITEVLLGIVCVIIGFINIGIYTSPYRSSYSYPSQFLSRYGYARGLTFGEGIWGGLWIIVAGGIGIGAGRENSSRCLINTHMAFSIIGSIASFSSMIVAIALAVAAQGIFRGIALLVLSSILAVLSFGSFVILIVSASYCCSLVGCCGANNVQYGAPVTYSNAPVIVHSATQPGTVQYNQYPPSAPTPQQPYPQANQLPMTITQTVSQQPSQNPSYPSQNLYQQKDEGTFNHPQKQSFDTPPAYQKF